MSKLEIAEYIQKYAMAHYNDGGWDVIVECWELKDILEQIDDGESKEQALQYFKKIVAVWADQQADARNSVF